MSEESRPEPLLELKNVHKHFRQGSALSWNRQVVRAVNGVSFAIRQNETLSIVGESGCGKTTTAKMVLRLESYTSGSITFKNREVSKLHGTLLQEYRAAVQAVFQDPTSSLNPRLRCRYIVGEPIVINRGVSGPALTSRVEELLVAVGLNPTVATYYPHELSGGMKQRLAIARALSLEPSVVVLDEPVSALDVSIRAQIMNLLKDLQERFGISYLLIAHNLATVRYLSHRMVVMYLGCIVESGDAETIFAKPLHPYTQALISAAEANHPDGARTEIVLSGEVPSPVRPPPGCKFHTRCPAAFIRCPVEEPNLRELAPGHFVACHLY
jgi:oligopeptide transport system ATP-binding protein